jgi:hypothetical protein
MQGAQGQLTSSKGPEWIRIRRHEKGIGFPSKLLLLAKSKYHPLDLMCVQNKKEFSVQVKNKPRVKIQNMHLFLVHQFSWYS